MPDDVDATRYSLSTGEREKLLELAKKLESEQKRSNGASGNSGASSSMSSAAIEEAAPAIVAGPNSLPLLGSSAKAAESKLEEMEAPVATVTGNRPGAAVEEGNKKDNDETGRKELLLPCKLCGYQPRKTPPDFTASIADLKSSAEAGCIICMLFTDAIVQHGDSDIEIEEIAWISKERHLLLKRSNAEDRIYEVFITPGTHPLRKPPQLGQLDRAERAFLPRVAPRWSPRANIISV